VILAVLAAAEKNRFAADLVFSLKNLLITLIFLFYCIKYMRSVNELSRPVEYGYCKLRADAIFGAVYIIAMFCRINNLTTYVFNE